MTCFSTSDDSWAHTTTDPDRFNGLKPLPVGRLFNCTLSVQLSFFWKSNSPKTILTIFWHGYLWVVPHSRQGSQVQKVVLRNAHQGPTNRMWYQVSKKIDTWISLSYKLVELFANSLLMSVMITQFYLKSWLIWGYYLGGISVFEMTQF